MDGVGVGVDLGINELLTRSLKYAYGYLFQMLGILRMVIRQKRLKNNGFCLKLTLKGDRAKFFIIRKG